MSYFVSAIGTDSGKTIISALLCKAFNFDYYKPIQSGFPKDSDFVKQKVFYKKFIVQNETYLFKNPVSPHLAAKLENSEIQLEEIERYYNSIQNKNLIIEGAGGLLVPINNEQFIIDIPIRLNIEIILVVNFYLGSINHTLLSLQALKSKNAKVKGIVFNGTNLESEAIIMKHSPYKKLFSVNQINIENQEDFEKEAQLLKTNFAHIF